MAAFESLAKDVRACNICVETPQGNVLPHTPRPVLWGSAGSRILIAGQAPGTRVHASGKPFTDPSGDRLRMWMGVDEPTFYDQNLIAIVPMGFCFPGLDSKGGDLPPRRECAPQWRADVIAALTKIELVICVGMYALKWHLGPDCGRNLSDTTANWQSHAARNPPIVALPHPSWRNTVWLKRHLYVEAEIIPFLQVKVQHIVSAA